MIVDLERRGIMVDYGIKMDLFTTENFELLKQCGVELGPSWLRFSRKLGADEMRAVYRVIEFVHRMTADEDNHISFALGDWGNKAYEWFGEKRVNEWIQETNDHHSFRYYLLLITGKVLIKIQELEHTVLGICAFLHIKLTFEDFVSGDPKRTRHTFCELKQALKEREYFDPGFEQRLDAFGRARNRFVHRLWMEPGDTDLAGGPTMARMKVIEGFLLNLVQEAEQIKRVFYGMQAAIGLQIAKRDGVDLGQVPQFSHFRQYLPDFAAAQRRPQ
jgi:hypothetical protein